jgi:hypothetical protein
MLAEFQARYSTPYPHLLTDMDSAYKAALPEMFTRYKLQSETFAERRNRMLLDCMERFTSSGEGDASRIVLDAWAYLENRGANLIRTSQQLDADFVLFDDLQRVQNVHEKAYRNKRLAIFNQPPLNLIDPSDELFERVNAEGLESYEELGWPGLLDRYLAGEVFMANNPMSDIVNDKAIYAVLPELARIFFGENIELPIVDSMPCWSLDDHRKPNKQTLSEAKANRDQYVIAHRYLEGGMGIRVGPVTSSEEWDSFIDTFVEDRPYLYVIRSYFPMDPDMSLRILASASMQDLTADVQEAELEFTDTLYARLTTQPPLSTDNHRSFLVYRTDESAPEPRYEFEEESVR